MDRDFPSKAVELHLAKYTLNKEVLNYLNKKLNKLKSIEKNLYKINRMENSKKKILLYKKLLKNGSYSVFNMYTSWHEDYFFPECVKIISKLKNIYSNLIVKYTI